MTTFNALHEHRANAETLLELASTDETIRRELVRLIEINLNQERNPATLSSQARYAMRLSNAGVSKGVRHSEL